MTTQESIKQYTINQLVLAVGASQSVIRLNSLNDKGIEVANDLKALGAQLDKIQECKDGICALTWKPARQ